MRLNAAIVVLLFLTGCRGEPVPRDYQNHPPAMTNPVDKPEEAPASHTTNTTGAEPDYGAEGTSAPDRPFEPTPTEGDKATSTQQPTTTTHT